MFCQKLLSQCAAFCCVLVSLVSAEVQLTGADHYALPPGETITLSGSGLEDATAARMVLVGFSTLNHPATFNPIDASTLEVVMPDVQLERGEHYLVVETASGSTVGIPSNHDEHTGNGPATSSSASSVVVVKAGAILNGQHSYELVYVETGGVLVAADNSSLGMIIAEDGATVDFIGAPSDKRGTFLQSPETVVVGTIPTRMNAETLTPIKASFGIDTFTVGYPINLSLVGDGTVSASPELAYYPDNTYVELTAIPEANSTFSGWTGDVVSSSPTIGVNAGSAALNLTATFSPGWLLEQYDIPGVNVTASPDLSVYPEGESVTLTATVESGYTFLGWGGDATGTELSTTLTMDANKQVIPIVRKDGYEQLPQVTGADWYVLPEGETITLSGSGLEDANAARMTWFGFSTLNHPATVNPIDNSTLEVVMPNVQQDRAQHTLIVETASGSTVGIPSGYIEHTGKGTAASHPSRSTAIVRSGAVLSGSHSFELIVVETGGVLEVGNNSYLGMIIAEDGAVVDFTGAPSDKRGSFLQSPETAVVGTIPTRMNAEAMTSIKASFGIGTFTVGYPINLSLVGDGTVSASPDLAYYPHNTYVDLTATPGANSTFSGWTGDVVSSSPTIMVNAGSAAISLTATFSPGWLLEQYDIPGVNVTASPDLSVYPEGESVTLTATVESGYTFLGWGGDATGTELSTTLTMDANKQVIPIVRKDGYEQLPQVTGADLYVLPEGETITLGGSGLEDTNAARMVWTGFSTLNHPATVNPIDTSTLEVVMPEVQQDRGEHYLIVETSSGSTVGIPSGHDEHTGNGTATDPSNRGAIVVKAGAVLSGQHTYELVYVETGGTLALADNSSHGMIIAEDGAVVDFIGASSDKRGSFLQSPETVVVGTIPTMINAETLTSIKASYGIGTFTVGYPLNLTIEGPGSVTVTPEKNYYASGEAVSLIAVPDPDTYFIRWIGSISGHNTTINLSMQADTMQTARFSTAPDYFSNWRLEHFTAEELEDANISAFDADPDGDSITNAAEYAFGTDPRDPSKRYKIKVAKEKVDGEFQFRVRYSRPKDALDVTYQILISKDFVTWNFNGDDTDLVYSQVVGTESIDEENEEVIVQLFPQSEAPSTFFVKISAILF